MKKTGKQVIPGLGLTMGVTIAMLSIIVLIPLASLVVFSARLGIKEFFDVITRERVLASFYVSFITALTASLINAVMGIVLAWVLVRYEFPGKRIMDGMIELPALPEQWNKGSVRGLVARGAFVVDIEWDGSQLSKARIISRRGGTLRLRSFVPLHGEGLKAASGTCPNELLAPAAIKSPKVSDEIRPQSPIFPKIYEYDIVTTPGQIINVNR